MSKDTPPVKFPKSRTPKVVPPRGFELSNQTLQICHQALAAVPASNAQQAQVLAHALSELEMAMKLQQTPVAVAANPEVAKAKE